MHPSSRRAFTLVELLITIVIIAVLAVVVVTTINPVQLLAQSRDSGRISDVRTLYGAVNFYKSDQLGSSQFFLGSSSVIYVSLPDANATTTAGSNCASLNLPVLPSNYTYHCAGPNYYRKTNGTGWIPVNFASSSVGSPLGTLPIDPKNASFSRLYYTYTTNGFQFEFTTAMESAKYKLGGSNDQISGDGGTLASVYEKGTAFGLEPLDYGDSSLVGLWTMNEGTGSTTQDVSGNNNLGTWYGTASGTNNTYYTTGKVGPWAGYFNGVNNYISAPCNISSNAETISFWFNTNDATTVKRIVEDNWTSNGNFTNNFTGTTGTLSFGFYFSDASQGSASITGIATGTWYMVTQVYDGSKILIYKNGTYITGSTANKSLATSTANIQIGSAYSKFGGLIDDVRVYNRALSAAEIQAIYNGGK